MLYVVDLHRMVQKNPCTGQKRPAWRRQAEGGPVADPAGMVAVTGTSVLHFPGQLLLAVCKMTC